MSDGSGVKLSKLICTVPSRAPRCFHLAGRGGAKAAVREVAAALPDNRFVFRTDVKSYYASIDHECLLAQVRRLIPDAGVVVLIEQYIHRTVNDGGLYEDVTRGICLGCIRDAQKPASPHQ